MFHIAYNNDRGGRNFSYNFEFDTGIGDVKFLKNTENILIRIIFLK